MSDQVERLESQLRIPLPDQTRYRVRLTLAGEALLAEARRLLAHADRVFYLDRFTAEKLALRMGSGIGWMPSCLVNRRLSCGSVRKVRYAGGSRYSFTSPLIHRATAPLGRTARRLAEPLPGDSVARHGE